MEARIAVRIAYESWAPPREILLHAMGKPRNWLRSGLGLCLLALTLVLPAQGAAEPVHYRLDLHEPSPHLVRVTMTVPDAAPLTEFQFPAWNNLYQIRDFVRNVQELRAQCDGKPAALERLDLSTWRGPASSCASLELTYAVYANEEPPFSSVLDGEHAFLNFAMLLFYLPRERGRSVRVEFVLPSGWKLATLLDGDGPEYQAANYDVLADSPAEAGNFQEYTYTQGAATYRVIVHADPAAYSASHLLESLAKITATETRLMQDVPFSRYTFIFHFLSHGGGMEHRNGTAISVPASAVRDNWRSVEGVSAHEFFHLWNVKRIRPQALEPIDYIHGNDTRDLWFCEGVTSAYGELALLRAGLISRRDFYASLAGEIQSLQARPARLFQSAELSGREAWLEKYPDYHRPERSISYYNKGALLGFWLDLAIRHASSNQAGLDDVMRRLNEEFARRGRSYTLADLRAIIAQLAPEFTGLEAFIRDNIQGTRELDYEAYLGYAGLQLLSESRQVPDPGFSARRTFEGRIEVESVEPGSGAAQAGLQVGDVLLKMNGKPLGDLPSRVLSARDIGQNLKFQLLRRRRTFEVEYRLGSREEITFRVAELPRPNAEQLQVREGWLSGETAAKPATDKP
jgi:predicted metalloprotease with PDZ domain